MMQQAEHTSVLLEESLAALDIKPAGTYVDATFGRGGHTAAILQRLDSNAKLLVIDKDPDAIAVAEELAAKDPRVQVCVGSFKKLSTYCKDADVVGKVDGILFDLGVSSPQLDQADRGFSFLRDGKLDMRMDPTSGPSVAEWLATADATDIANVLYTLGEERFSRRIAKAIVETREQKAITTTTQLANIIANAVPIKEKHKHPATRSFQALRIFINAELDEITVALDQALQMLAPNGRVVVISFHSLEDRIVKQFINKHAKGDDFPAKLPITQAQLNPKLRKVGKAVKPSAEEINNNVRARSAVLRVAEKLKEAKC